MYTRFYDGKNYIDIQMSILDKYGEFKSDFQDEFFDVGGLEYDDEFDAYIVDDVYYLGEQVEDFIDHSGDFVTDGASKYEIADICYNSGVLVPLLPKNSVLYDLSNDDDDAYVPYGYGTDMDDTAW